MEQKSNLDFAADAVIRRAKILARAQMKVVAGQSNVDGNLLNFVNKILQDQGAVLVLAAEDEVRKMRGDY